MAMEQLTKFIIEPEDGGGEHEELGTHHEYACSDIMVFAYAKRGKRKSDSSEERADGDDGFYTFIFWHGSGLKGVRVWINLGLAHPCAEYMTGLGTQQPRRIDAVRRVILGIRYQLSA